ncbi:hypothetical protein C8E03_1032 [Lachnotalea glycerini]|uniref:Uncharacterized protein n=1 Tax=Lachnotalea glycerini TaxID=1763509 RepID=A0A318EPW8_9FIRM|nr:DUF6625 family protein [Lachnotalea glycerini]PXV91446.1 hypothetical protein C8E03_1032 [Lachnotalea glycerini]
MKKIVLIISYFGKFPSYFSLFLKSCKYNKQYTWLIYTDNEEEYLYPENVLLKKLSFRNMTDKINKKFDFPIEIRNVHKLCDFKPAYGYIFEEDIQEYDFWGFCDLDVIWGDLSKFITDDILNNYEKIYTLGHLTLFKNTIENNRRFMNDYHGEKLYKKAFLKHNEWVFDEGYKGSINNLFETYNVPIYKDSKCADIYTKSSNFKLVTWYNNTEKVVDKNKKGLFWWNKGILLYMYIEKGKLIEEEYTYIHLQKRKMKVKEIALKTESIKIVPNVFEAQTDDVSLKNFNKIKKKYFNLHYFVLRSKNLKYKIKFRLGMMD